VGGETRAGEVEKLRRGGESARTARGTRSDDEGTRSDDGATGRWGRRGVDVE